MKFSDQLQAGQGTGKWQFERDISVVGFAKRSGVRDFITLKKEYGELSDKGLGARLRESRLIALDRLIVEYQDRKFVDHPPPLPYLLQVIWDHVLTKYAAEAPKDESLGWIPLSVSLEQVTEHLQDYFGFRSTGPRSPEIPRAKWVRRALDALVSFGMAEAAANAQYVVRYKRGRTDTLRKFGLLCFKREQKAKRKPSNQMTLFPDAEPRSQ